MILILLNNSFDSSRMDFLYLLSVKIIPLLSSLALWRNFVKFAAYAIRFASTPILSSIAFCKILSKSPFSPDSSKSPLSRYPYLEHNQSSAKFRQNRYSRRIRRICQNRHFVGTPISNSITLRRNFVKMAILSKFGGFVKIAASSVPPSRT